MTIQLYVRVLQCVAVCYSVLQYVAVCYTVLQRVAVRCSSMTKQSLKRPIYTHRPVKDHIYRSLLYVSFSIYTSVLTYIRLMYRFLGLTLRLA